jgi:energy-coupling factor transport system ATP-binding protein
MEAVVVRGLTYRYVPGGPAVLQNVYFNVRQGEILAVTGLSGCGKSTLCYCLGGFIPHCQGGEMSGEILINGKNTRNLRMAALALEVGMVFQDPDTQLFSPTVEDEVAFAPENLCLAPDRIRERVDQGLKTLGMCSFTEVNPNRLSGGEKQKIALAAVLALDPSVLILDEVMSQLDDESRKQVVGVLQNLKEAGKTIIVVEHNLEVLHFADRLMVMRDGRPVSLGLTEHFLNDREFLLAQHLVEK